MLGAQEDFSKDWPRYCRKVYWTKMVRNGQDDHFGQNDLVPNRILVFARPKWTKMPQFGPFWPEEAHFGSFGSVNRTLATPDSGNRQNGVSRVLSQKQNSMSSSPDSVSPSSRPLQNRIRP